MALPKINVGFKSAAGKLVPSGDKLADKVKNRLKQRTKGHALKATSGTKFVLLVGDEGAILVYFKDNVVQSRQFVPDTGVQSIADLRASLAVDEKAPILLAVDSIDQSYIQQTLPPVSALSVKKLIKRRLDRDFGPNDLKGAIMLGRETGARKDWNFLMVALERNAQLNAWLDFVTELPNRCQGIYLVSVEAEIMMHNLEAALGAVEGEPSEWKFLVSHNKVSGFRQVILRNGRIIFTRVAQPIGDSTPEVVAGSIEQEMLSTIEYMRRLSFSTQAGLDITIIASAAIKAAIDRTKFETRNMRILTPHEVGQALGLEGATQPADQFGDIVLAASIGSTRKHILTLYTPESKEYDNLYRLLLAQRLGAAMVALGIVFYAVSIIYGVGVAYESRQELTQQKHSQETRFSQLQEEIRKSNLDVERTNDMIDLYGELQQQRQTPLAFIATLETVIKPPIIVKSIEWSGDVSTGGPATPPPPTPAPVVAKGAGAATDTSKVVPPKVVVVPKIAAVLTLDFPGVTTLEAFKAVSKKLLEDLKNTFKDYDIAYTKIPTAFAEDEKLNMTFDNKDAAPAVAAGGVSEVQLSIKGDMITAFPTALPASPTSPTPSSPALPTSPSATP